MISLLATLSPDGAEAIANFLLLAAEEFEACLPFKLAERRKVLQCVVALDVRSGSVYLNRYTPMDK